MSLIKCPYCGNKYSETYDECPFCDEEAPQDGRSTRRKAQHKPKKNRTAHRGSGAAFQLDPGLLSPILIVVLLLMIALLIYLLFGQSIKENFGDGDAPSIETVEPKPEDSKEPEEPTPSEPTMPEEDVNPVPSTPVKLNRDDFTLPYGDPFTIETTGGSGVYTFTMADTSVATVSPNGSITTVGNGTTTLTVTDGYTSDECVVRVKNAPTNGNSTATAPSTGSTAFTLSHTDVTIKVNESFTLKASTGTPVYHIGDESIVSVGENGQVTGLTKGSTNISVTVGDTTQKCLVRVK